MIKFFEHAMMDIVDLSKSSGIWANPCSQKTSKRDEALPDFVPKSKL